MTETVPNRLTLTTRSNRAISTGPSRPTSRIERRYARAIDHDPRHAVRRFGGIQRRRDRGLIGHVAGYRQDTWLGFPRPQIERRDARARRRKSARVARPRPVAPPVTSAEIPVSSRMRAPRGQKPVQPVGVHLGHRRQQELGVGLVRWPNSSVFGPRSTTRPCCITTTSSAMARTVARSWVMNM